MGISNLGRSIFRIGEVTSTLPNKGKVKVKFEDMDDLVSYEMWVLNRKTREDKDYWMPDIKDQVFCLFLGNGMEAGCVLGAIYSDKDKPPVNSQDKRHVRFKDGSVFEYDRKTHALTVDVKGDISIRATGNVMIDALGGVSISGGGGVMINEPTAGTVNPATGNCCCAGSCESDYQDSCCGATASGNMCCGSSCAPNAATNCMKISDLGNLILRN